jgi:hypothetical protein
MTIREAAIQLVAIRRKWRNNGSSVEFSKSEMEVFQEFKRTNGSDWETTWPTVQLAAHKVIP